MTFHLEYLQNDKVMDLKERILLRCDIVKMRYEPKLIHAPPGLRIFHNRSTYSIIL
jgi:hypothetical protein